MKSCQVVINRLDFLKQCFDHELCPFGHKWKHEIVTLMTLLKIIHKRNLTSETSFCLSKGHIISKAIYGFLNSPKK